MLHSRRLALAVLCTGALMAIVDETIVAVSLPAIQRDLGFSKAGLAWVTGAYLIAFAGLLLLSGRLGDLVGRKRVFLSGLAVFTVASAMCGLAWNAQALVVARFAQGVGGAALTAVILGMIVTLFPQPADRARAIGAFSFVQASGGTIGTLAGGLITQVASWHWIFFLNVPIGIIAVLLACRLLATEPGLGLDKGADIAGAALVTASLMAGIYTIIRVEEVGWASAHTAGFGALSLLLLAAFVLRQVTAADPLLTPRLLRSRPVLGANAVLFLLVASMFGFMFVTVLNLRNVLGFSPRDTGFAVAPVAVAIAVVSLSVAPRLNVRFGERRVLPAGLVVISSALGLLGLAPADAEYPTQVLPALLLLGIGFGAAMPALLALGMSGAEPKDSGLASGLFNTTQQLGAALGLSVLLVLAATRADRLMADGATTTAALLAGYQLVYRVAAATVLLALLITVTMLRGFRRRARQPAAAAS